MAINASEYKKNYNFIILGVSYIGKPKENSVMYVGKKLADQLPNLSGVKNVLCFTDVDGDISENISAKNAIVYVKNPQLEFSKVAARIEKDRTQEESRFEYDYVDGSYISKMAKIGKNSIIEPGCFIGHNVIIGDNAILMTGTVIKNSIIGNDFYANEFALIGTNAFTMTVDEEGDRVRIPSLGKVIIGDEVEVGASNNISRGSVSDTIIKDNVKLDAMVHVGHDCVIEKNTEIAAGTVIGGFATVGEGSFLGLNSTLKNRIVIGKNSLIGMGADVMKSFSENMSVIGRPAMGMPKDNDKEQ